MDLLIDRERYLARIETDGKRTIVSPKRSTEGTGTHGGIIPEVLVRVFTVQGRVLDIGVPVCSNLVSSLHEIRERVIVVVDMVGCTDSKAPS